MNIILFIGYRLGAMRQKENGNQVNHATYNQKIQQFLSTWKVTPCPNQYTHVQSGCYYYHSREDKRRNPYTPQGFTYYPTQLCICDDENCQNYHNYYEAYYHPFRYKTANCPQYPCLNGPFCYGIHTDDIPFLQKSKFFRFDLNTFKTQPCHQMHNSNNEYASCRFYHGEGDHRRNPKKVAYSHVQCSKINCNDPQCPYAHNKIEQLYHPSRYKSKYCQSFLKKGYCQYQDFCSFAHNDQQITIELLHLLPKNTEFYYYKYKTIWCPYTQSHERGLCPYAHNFQDFRRDPRAYPYRHEECPYWIKKGEVKSLEQAGCPLKMQCLKSHGWLQSRFHPDNPNNSSCLSEEEQDKMSQTSSIKEVRGEDDWGAGAPFFIIQKQANQQRRSRSKKKDKTVEKTTKLSEKKEKIPKKLFFCGNQDEKIWQPSESGDETQSSSGNFYISNRKTKVVKRLKRQPSYSTSLKQLLSTFGLEQKLKPDCLNQKKLIGMAEEEIESLDYLKTQEKLQLKQVVEKYIIEHRLQEVKYSKSMVNFFKLHHLGDLLGKLCKKRINQRQLEELSSSSIDELSFLEEDQKESLPTVISRYVNDRAFREINTLIHNQIQESVT